MRPIDIPAGRPTPPADGPPRTARWPGAAAEPLFLDFDPVLPWWPPATAGRYDTHHRPSTGGQGPAPATGPRRRRLGPTARTANGTAGNLNL